MIHRYHLQITGYCVYKLINPLKSQFLYLSDYDNNHFCSICQCRRHRVDSWSRKIPHAADQLRAELQLLSLCSRAQDPQLLKLSCPRTQAPQQKKSQQGAACALQLYGGPRSMPLGETSTATKTQHSQKTTNSLQKVSKSKFLFSTHHYFLTIFVFRVPEHVIIYFSELLELY